MSRTFILAAATAAAALVAITPQRPSSGAGTKAAGAPSATPVSTGATATPSTWRASLVSAKFAFAR